MVITELDVGGAEKAFVRIATGLKQKHWKIHVVSLRDPGPLAATLQQNAISVTALHCGGFLDLRAITRLRTVLNTIHPTAILSFLHQANIVSRLAGRLAHVPLCISGVRVADRRLSVTLSEQLTRPWTDHYIAVSEAVGQVHKTLCDIPENRISAIRNGVDFEELDAFSPTSRSLLNLQSQDFVILCAGRLTPQKNPQLVLQAFQQLLARSTPLPHPPKLIFAGEGPLRESLQQSVQRAGLEQDVRFAGWRADLPGLMKAANVLVLASEWEGLPNVIAEAQAVGLPVISSRADGCTELITPGITGQLFDCSDVNALVQLLSAQLHDATKAQQMARTAASFVRTHLTWQSCIDQYDTLLQRLINHNTKISPR